jgi:phenylpyruvate tautomerase PptA (4-oxalocrotonate tautomerase family)
MQWDDRQCIAPIADFRSDLITITKDIRQRVNERSAELNENEKKAIREVTNDFMKLAGKHQKKTNVVWIQKVEKEMLEVCKRMREIAARLT